MVLLRLSWPVPKGILDEVALTHTLTERERERERGGRERRRGNTGVQMPRPPTP